MRSWPLRKTRPALTSTTNVLAPLVKQVVLGAVMLDHVRAGNQFQHFERALEFVAMIAAAHAIGLSDILPRRRMERVGPERGIAKPLAKLFDLPVIAIVQR